MKNFKSWCAAIAAMLVLLLAVSSSRACFTVVVGKDASASGAVIIGHNEDDSAPVVVNHHKIARLKHPPGAKVKLLGGGVIDQVPETWAYMWEEMPGMLFSDSFLNEWGVSVTSDNCPSREDRADLTDGGISKDLRALIAQRAKSAREGVALAAQLVERFGYDASGRTYIIADPKEGWFFCVVNGKHWLARRVPDDQVAMVANTYSVRQVSLKDSANVKYSADLIKYAQKRGWYHAKSGQFDFGAAFADPEVAADSSNFGRQWAGLNHVSSAPLALSPNLPFAVTPKQKLDVAAVKEVLRDHYEMSQLYRPSEAEPHSGSINPICNEATQTSYIAELRDNMPADIGLVYWVTLGPPCTSAYLPFHFGISDFPAGYDTAPESPTISAWNNRVAGNDVVTTRLAYWAFSGYHRQVWEHYSELSKSASEAVAAVERRARVLQKPVEAAALELYPTDKVAALEMLETYSYGLYLRALDAMSKVQVQK